MSDRETVTIEAAQFEALKTRLETLAARIGPANEEFSLHQVLSHLERTLHDGFELLAGNTSGSNNTELLTAINNLTNLVKENFMGLREDNEALTGKFDTLETAVTAVAEDISALKTELKEANERANIDLSPLIARADSIEAGLRAAVGAGPGSDPETPPGGGDAGGDPGTSSRSAG